MKLLGLRSPVVPLLHGDTSRGRWSRADIEVHGGGPGLGVGGGQGFAGWQRSNATPGQRTEQISRERIDFYEASLGAESIRARAEYCPPGNRCPRATKALLLRGPSNLTLRAKSYAG